MYSQCNCNLGLQFIELRLHQYASCCCRHCFLTELDLLRHTGVMHVCMAYCMYMGMRI